MTREEFDKLDEGAKKFFAKEGEELRPITEMTKEDLVRHCKELQEMFANLPELENWGFDESGHLQLIDTSYGGIL